jgi:type II secretory pathway component PulF
MVVVGCLYFVCLAVGFGRAILPFTKLYEGLGVELPLPTRILLSFHSWFAPIVFALAAMLTVAKKLVEFSRRQLRVVNIALVVIGAVLPGLFVLFLYLPLFVLIGKLGRVH